MGDVWLGSYKLFVVIARFVDGEKGMEDKSDQRKVSVEKKTVVDKPVIHKTVETESFCDILTNKKQAVDHMVIKIDGNVNAFVNWYEYALLLKEFGYNRVDIKYVGGFRVVLIFHDAELLTYFKEFEDVWKGWFECLEGWEGQSFQYECIAWLKIHGVPLHLCMDPVLSVIGSKFGLVIQEAQMGEDVGDLSYACIGILSDKSARVNDKVELSWNDKTYTVWVEEEMGEWIPDCLVMFDEGSSVAGSEEFFDGGQGVNSGDGGTRTGDVNVENDKEDGEWIEWDRQDVTDTHTTPVFDLNISLDMAKEDEGGVGDRKKMRRKAFKKKRGGRKGGSHSSVSLSGQDRPRKQSRREEDPFDIDRFIGIVSTGVNSVEQSVGGDDGQSNECNSVSGGATLDIEDEDVEHHDSSS
ncbi:hypothetical protein HanPSC8_Chr11g0495351 [Helianthus annuus]|nr:hypothetical protein HanIR_Chr11g0552541 [Helianthus annuus]KAJ0877023.1 hypothetical protein HanPSC8_Chr11g0495351 [Helianthus annuus]